MIDQEFITVLLEEDTPDRFLENGITTIFLEDDTCKLVLTFILNNIKDYNKIPNRKTIETLFPKFEFSKETESLPFYFDLLKKRRRHSIIFDAIRDATESMDDYLKVDGVVARLRKGLISAEEFIEEREIDLERDATEYLKRLGEKRKGLLLGIEEFDKEMLGLEKSDILTVLGRPDVGKTWLLCWFLARWSFLKHKPLFVSCELSPEKIIDRVGSILTRIPYSKIRARKLGDAEKEVFRHFVEKHKMRVSYGGKTVASLRNKIDRYGPDMVLIDSVYLMGSTTKAREDWQRITSLVREIRNLTTATEIPFIMSSQMGRESKKMGVREGGDLEHVAFSDAIGQSSDYCILMYGSRKTSMRLRLIKAREVRKVKTLVSWDIDNCDMCRTIKKGEEDEEGDPLY